MKLFLLIAVTCGLAHAAPQPSKLQFRNLYKEPVFEIKAKPSPRIIGGNEAEPHSIPYQAFLEIYSQDKGWYCGGSLISENYILTAAHCGKDAVRAHITLGAHKALEDEGTQVSIISTDIRIHEGFDSKESINDIGVIKLPEAVSFTEAIQIVKLPTRADSKNSYEGDSARISGWGLTDGFDTQISEVLNFVDVKVITNQECEDTFGSLLDSIVCTSGDDDTGSCNGDSGGPLVDGGVQIGVVSYGMLFCLPGFPSAFTRVASFLDWIESNTDIEIE